MLGSSIIDIAVGFVRPNKSIVARSTVKPGEKSPGGDVEGLVPSVFCGLQLMED